MRMVIYLIFALIQVGRFLNIKIIIKMERREDQGVALKEAEKAFKKGEASLKTGMFKWSANFSDGQIYFEKAAKAYKQLGEKPRAVDAFLRYSACCEALNENYGAADGLVQAA